MTLQYTISGLIAGIFSFLLFIRNSGMFFKWITPAIPTAIPILSLAMYQPIVTDSVVLTTYFSTAAGWTLGFIGGLFTLVISSKDTGLRFFHIILGNHHNYLDHKILLEKKRQELADKEQEIESKHQLLLKEKNTFESEKKEVEKRLKAQQKELSDEISAQKKELNLEQREIHRSIRSLKNSENGIPLRVISTCPIFMDQEHIRLCAKHNRNICTAIAFIKKDTDEWTEYLKAIEIHGKDFEGFHQELKDTITSYFSSVALYIGLIIFASPGCRVHFRILKPQKDVYQSLVAVNQYETKVWDSAMSEIPFTESLIERSWKEGGAPIIMSLNKGDAYRGTPMHKWQDFLTIALTRPTLGSLPMFTFGISVDQQSGFDTLLKHLCHIRFDRILEDTMKPFTSIINDFPDELKLDIITPPHRGALSWTESAKSLLSKR